jgi:hypothetical protein
MHCDGVGIGMYMIREYPKEMASWRPEPRVRLLPIQTELIPSFSTLLPAPPSTFTPCFLAA